jgi:hypothetical protein
MNATSPLEPCPVCNDTAGLRPKLLLIDEAWVPAPGKDSRLAFVVNLRVDDLLPEHVKSAPLEQFVDGFYCEACKKGFVTEAVLRLDRRQYW